VDYIVPAHQLSICIKNVSAYDLIPPRTSITVLYASSGFAAPRSAKPFLIRLSASRVWASWSSPDV
jgi:hypothetical protein